MSKRVHIASVDHPRRIAKRRLPKSVYNFVEGGSEAGLSVAANVDGFREIGFRPRVAVDHEKRDLRVTVLGRELSLPVITSPAGFIRIVHPEGEIAVAKAAQSAGTAVAISTMSSRAIEEITAVADDVWYQVYMLGGRPATEMAVERAAAAGCRVLLVTVDVAAISRPDRPGRATIPNKVDLRTALSFAPEMVRKPRWLLNFLRGGLKLEVPNVVTSDGLTMSVAESSAEIAKYPPTWEDIAWIRERWKGPLVAKGIMTAEDTRRAIDAGVDGVVVSNHGGNSLDGAPATIRVLPEVVAAANGQLEVLLDGGVRRGSDVVKAVALGARAVLVGRPYIWGLAADGEQGARRILEVFRKGIDNTLALLGCSTLDEVDTSHISVPLESNWYGETMNR